MPSKKGSKKNTLKGGKVPDKTYCVYCKKPTTTLKAQLSRTSNGRNMMRGTCKDCGHGKTSFVKG